MGKRLYPMTSLISKQLLPIYDKPMIFYPLSMVMLSNIKEILIISTESDIPLFQKLLGDGSSLGLNIQYEVQEKPNGLPEAFIIGEKFIGNDSVMLVLGDNLFHGNFDFVRGALEKHFVTHKSFIFACQVADPRAYGVIQFSKETNEIISIEEKPKFPKSDYAIPGLYIFSPNVVDKAKKLKPSARGETEIVDLLRSYLDEGLLSCERVNRGVAWLDTGTPMNLADASNYIATIEARQGLKVACLEEVALRMGYVTKQEFIKLAEKLPECSYRDYLFKIVSEF